ncbi:MAG: hypothetical protein NW206_16880 [Hyphomonadaceae bacterium]|nr:hypothetical protein [Hyphomonadaceae bacterium]
MRLAALVSILALAACQRDAPPQEPTEAAAPVLTVEGYGSVRIGMTLEQARAATGAALDQGAGVTDEDAEYCQEQRWTLADGDKLYLMFEQNRLTRITADSGAPHVRTAENVGVGSSDADVRGAYQGLIETPSEYSAPPAHDLIAWTKPDRTGIRFEVNEAGIVTQVHAGRASILYVEGCA